MYAADSEDVHPLQIREDERDDVFRRADGAEIYNTTGSLFLSLSSFFFLSYFL